ARTLSGVLRKRFTPWRAYLPFGPPDAMLQLMLGEVASVITTGQKVLPAKALGLGYSFQYPNLEGALRASFAKTREPSQATAHPVAASPGSRHQGSPSSTIPGTASPTTGPA